MSNSYPGGKSQAGTFQKIINQIPPHDLYYEFFAGHAGIYRAKRQSKRSVLVEIDPVACDFLRENIFIDEYSPKTHIIRADVLKFIKEKVPLFGEWRTDIFAYFDPPYLKVDVDGTPIRKGQSDIYNYEFASIEEHTKLLETITCLRFPVAISGYWSSLYMSVLEGWRTISFDVVTRSGDMATEWVWMNYPEPNELHDYSFLGDNFREREKITRQKRRWIARLNRMDRLQRLALMDAINSLEA